MSSRRFQGWLSVLLLISGAGAFAATPSRTEDPPEVRYAAMLEREYGPLGTTTDQILGREKTHEPVTIVGALMYRLRAKPVERLSAVEKKLLAADDVRQQVTNGGFDQYFTEATGNGAALALQALREMGSPQLAKLLQKAMGIFPNGKPPVDLAQRQKALDKLRRRASAVWGACEDEFYQRVEDYPALALAYAKKYRSQIILP